MEQYGARVAGGSPASDGGDGDESTPETRPQPLPLANASNPLFTSRDGRVVIDARRLEHGEVAPEERAQLIALLEALLTKTRHARLKL